MAAETYFAKMTQIHDALGDLRSALPAAVKYELRAAVARKKGQANTARRLALVALNHYAKDRAHDFETMAPNFERIGDAFDLVEEGRNAFIKGFERLNDEDYIERYANPPESKSEVPPKMEEKYYEYLGKLGTGIRSKQAAKVMGITESERIELENIDYGREIRNYLKYGQDRFAGTKQMLELTDERVRSILDDYLTQLLSQNAIHQAANLAEAHEHPQAKTLRDLNRILASIDAESHA